MCIDRVDALYISKVLELRNLIIVNNNAFCSVVRFSVLLPDPDGTAERTNEMPLTAVSPVPSFNSINEAGCARVEKLDHIDDLPSALKQAIAAIRMDRRQSLLDVRVEVLDAP